jgi:hypothetical protein
MEVSRQLVKANMTKWSWKVGDSSEEVGEKWKECEEMKFNDRGEIG